jgi:hypothetical protein
VVVEAPCHQDLEGVTHTVPVSAAQIVENEEASTLVRQRRRRLEIRQVQDAALDSQGARRLLDELALANSRRALEEHREPRAMRRGEDG